MTVLARALDPIPAAVAGGIRLGLLTPHNVLDRRAFSGTAFHAARALSRAEGVELRLLGGHHRPPGLADRLARRLGRPAPQAIPPGRDALAGLDAVIGLVASDLLDALPSGTPYLHVTDATPAFLAEHYGWHMPPEVHAREARVAARALACLYSSDMMATRARRELPGGQAFSRPFGINLDTFPSERPEKAPLDAPEILYVGTDWDRKGGEIALEALAHLRASGVPARLTLVGRIPEHARHRNGVTVEGFLDKTKPRDAARLSRLYARAHLLVLPTRGDCTPMIIAEAMAHGTPVLATDTGGIPEMLGGRASGELLPLSASGADWARTIRRMVATQAAWDIQSDAAFDRAASVFSWDGWAARVAEVARMSLAQLDRAA